jgi:DNA-directed RNA polymerase subunit RPC12/RpoP
MGESDMAAINEYKCPFCGGAVTFDSDLQKMRCPYCDAEFEIEQMETEPDGAEVNTTDSHIQETGYGWEITSATQWQDTDEDGIYAFLCKTCGGEIVGDQNLAATSCPYCGNPVVIQGRLTGDLKPDYVIPFKLDKKAAKEALNRHYVGKKLLPKVFKNKNHMQIVIYIEIHIYIDHKTIVLS